MRKKIRTQRIVTVANRLAYLFISRSHVTLDQIGCVILDADMTIRVCVCVAIMKIILTGLCVRNQFVRLQLWPD